MALLPRSTGATAQASGSAAGRIALISLVPLAVAGSAGTIAINIGPDHSSRSDAPDRWAQQLAITGHGQTRSVRRSQAGDIILTSDPTNAIVARHPNPASRDSLVADAVIELDVARSELLGDGYVPVPIHYRLSGRKGWVNARITASVLGGCEDQLGLEHEDGPADRSPPCKRWFDVPGAREGPGVLQVWVPEAQIRASGALRLHVRLDLETRRNGRARFEIEQIGIGR